MIIYILLGIVFAYCFTGFLAAPFFMKSYFTRKTELFFNTKVKIRSVAFDPFSFCLRIFKISLFEDEIDEIKIHINVGKSIFKFFPVVDCLSISAKKVKIDEEKGFDFSSFIKFFCEQGLNFSIEKKFFIKKIKMEIKELIVPDPFKNEDCLFENFTLDGKNLSNISFEKAEPSEIKFSLNFKDGIVKGDFNPGLFTDDFYFTGDLNLFDMELGNLNLLPDDLNLISIEKGSFQSSLNIDFNCTRLFKIGGNFLFNDLLVKESNENDFFMFHELKLELDRFIPSENLISIESLLINGLELKLIKKNRELNLDPLFKNLEKRKKDKKGTSFKISISNTEVNMGKIGFLDLDSPLYRPESSASQGIDENSRLDFLYEDGKSNPYIFVEALVKKAVLGSVSSEKKEQGKLKATGFVDDVSYFKIEGELNPLLRDISASLDILLKNFDLVDFSPYSRRSIGREIKKGQFSLELHHELEKRKIRSENRIIFHGLELGKRVKGFDFGKMPLGLAMPLLKDRNGEIILNIPVSGSFDDPKFDFGRVAAQVLKNLIVKAAASPLSIPTNLSFLKKEINAIGFDYGSLEVLGDGEKELEKIESFMFDRPGSNLEITGFADKLKDSKAIRDIRFQDILEKEKQKSEIKEENLEREEYIKLLEIIYEDMFKEKFVADKKQSYGIFLEGRIKSTIEVDDQELKFLAQERAKKVKSMILSRKRISGNRIFIKTSPRLEPKTNKMRFARVEFFFK